MTGAVIEQVTDFLDRRKYMKIFMYSCKADEQVILPDICKQYKVEIGFCETQPSEENIELAKGYDCVSMVGTILDNAVMDALKEMGIHFISTRSIGTDHLDIAHAKEIGMQMAHIVYSPNAIADFAIMLMLMSLRKAKYIMKRYEVRDYELGCNQGRELRNMTVGVVGTGRIGRTVMKQISGFGCKILAYDVYENEETKLYATYVPYEEILQKCDVITFHLPATEETHHMLNTENVMDLKPGVVLINTARGSLLDNKALILGIEANLIGAVGMDVIDHEPALYNYDHKLERLEDHDAIVLESFPNVILTPHTAFYTDQAIYDMVENSVRTCCQYGSGEKIDWQIA